MAYLLTPQLRFPLDKYRPTGLPFGKRAEHGGVFWGVHLGEDCAASAGTDVFAPGRGTVVYAALHPGSAEKGNWGHIIIIRHKRPKTKLVFYTLCAHLGTLFKKIDDQTEYGEPIGFVGEGMTPENGFWEAHLHFAVYTGPWKDGHAVLPGYWKPNDQRTRLKWWKHPSRFVEEYESIPNIV